MQLRNAPVDSLVKLILLLQDENDRVRNELEKYKLRCQVAEKKAEQVSILKASIKKN